MALRDYILSDKNIYLAIYSVKSYVFEPQLLEKKDKELLNMLIDPFNEKQINTTIRKVKNILTKIVDDEDYLFETQVYYKPKEYNADGAIYRPIHTAKLEQLIAMVALLHPLIYEIPKEENDWKLNLSNYCRLIPNNFYGNRVSKQPEELFKKWNVQYKKYTQKANEYFKTYHESKEFDYELKLDLENFFPSVNPLVVYGILIENMPVTLSDVNDVKNFKNLIYKLLVCKITNLDTELAKEKYYGFSKINMNYTRGIAQGLPQSYFFGNICMIEISKIFEKKYEGKAVYYVDDSYIYTKKTILDENDFKNQLEDINIQISGMSEDYIQKYKEDTFFINKKIYFEYNELLLLNDEKAYLIKVHKEGKSSFTPIQNVKDGEIYLRTLSREASQIGTDITSTYSEEEDETILYKIRALLNSIEAEKNGDLEKRKAYKDKLERYYKFFKYREIKLKLKTNKGISSDIFNILVGYSENENRENFDEYELLNKEIDVEKFFYNYKHDIWTVALSVLIKNTVFEHLHIKIRKYIRKIIKRVYPYELQKCSYI